jgi:hypothetical protein
MHFEEVVLRTLATAATEDDWSEALQAEIAAVTGDDAAMAVIGVGAELSDFQRLLAPRLAEVQERYTAPMDRLLDEVRAAEQTLARLQLRRAEDLASRWEHYREAYERLLGPEVEGGSEVPEDAVPRQIWHPAKPIATGAVAAIAGAESAGPMIEDWEERR